MTSPDSPRRRRRELLVEAQTLAQAADRIEDELKLFTERDLPAFTAWFAVNLGPERRLIRRLERRLSRLTELHNDVRALVGLRGISPARARALLALEDRALASAPPPVREHLVLERRQRRAFIAADLEREFRALAAPEPTLERTPDPADAVATAYRRLARRLHPDVSVDPDDEPETRWRARSWRALQEARDARDLGRIEALELVARVRQLDCGDFTADEGRRAHDLIRRDHDQRSADLERARRSIAWRFDARDPDHVLRQARTELRADARELRAEIAALGDDRPLPPRARPRPTTLHQLSLFD